MELLGANNKKYNDDPAHASMPFDTQRSGPVMSDGGGFVVLESLESALSRKPRPKIYCEVSGYSQNCDGFHILRPKPTGEGMFKAVKEALIEAKLTPNMIDSFNTHATSTIVGDQAEANFIKQILGDKNIWDNLDALKVADPINIEKSNNIQYENLKKAVITSQKGHIGHTFCASGALESVFSILSIDNNIIPCIRNLKVPLDSDLNFSMFKKQDSQIEEGV